MAKKVVSRGSYVDPSKVGTRLPTGSSSSSSSSGSGSSGPRPGETVRVRRGVAEANWACNSCGTANIPGGTKNCPNCNNAKDGSETYQPPVGPAPMLSPAQLEERGIDPINHDSDEVCSSCESHIKPGTQVCPHCGSNVKDVARTTRTCEMCGRESTGNGPCPGCGASFEKPQQYQGWTPEPMRRRLQSNLLERGIPINLYNVNWTAIGVGALAILVIFLIAFALWPRKETGTVVEASWKSTVFLQEYQYNQHGDWSVPPGGDLVGVSSKIHHYNQVLTGYKEECHYENRFSHYDTRTTSDNVCESVYSHTDYTCYDDGSCDTDDVYETECHTVYDTEQVAVYEDVRVCEDVPQYRQDPVYADYYTYNIWEWVSIAPAVLTGYGFEPQWPTDYRIDDTHREAGRQQTYQIMFQGKKNTCPYVPSSADEFHLYHIGSEWTVIRSGCVITEVRPLEE